MLLQLGQENSPQPHLVVILLVPLVVDGGIAVVCRFRRFILGHQGERRGALPAPGILKNTTEAEAGIASVPSLRRLPALRLAISVISFSYLSAASSASPMPS